MIRQRELARNNLELHTCDQCDFTLPTIPSPLHLFFIHHHPQNSISRALVACRMHGNIENAALPAVHMQ